MKKFVSVRLFCIILSIIMIMPMVLSGCGSNTASTGDASSSVPADNSIAPQDNNSAAALSYPTKKPEEYKGELDYWVWGDYEARCTEPFFKLYPNIKINFVKIANGDYFTKLQTAIAANSGMPDIANLEQTPRRTELNLNCWERLDAAPYNFDKSVIVDWALPLMTNDKGEITCAQIDNCIGGTVYNRNNVKKLWGISEVDEMESKFKTTDDYIAASAAFKGKDLGFYMFAGVFDVWDAFFQLFPEQYVTDDNVLNFEAAILPTFKIIQAIVANDAVGKIKNWTPQWSAAFATDYATFYSGVTWMVYDNIVPNNPKDTKDKFGLITPPGGGYNQGGTALAIPKSIPQGQKELAWEFIRWFTQSDSGAQAFLDRNHAPTLYKPFYTNEAYTTSVGNDPMFAGQNPLAKWMEISKNPNTKVRPMSKYDQLVSNSIQTALVEMGNGATAEEALKMVKKDVLSQAPELKDNK